MALPASGPISLGAIQTEYGGTNPAAISEYYRGGGLVPNAAPNLSVPTSGAISFSNFYGGAAAQIYLENENASRSTVAPTTAFAALRFLTAGTVEGVGISTTTRFTWLLSGASSDYAVRATLDSGDTPAGTLGTWTTISSTREWSLTQITNGFKSCSLTIEVRRVSDSVVLGSCTFTLDVSREP